MANPVVLCVRDPDYQPDYSVHRSKPATYECQDISVSPFTLVFQHAGLLSAAAVMNAVILTAVLSAGNSGMYASTLCCTPWRVTVKRRAFSLKTVAWWRAA
ncbi:hypothetical protein ACLB1Q_00490 [Escherichia coli]